MIFRRPTGVVVAWLSLLCHGLLPVSAFSNLTFYSDNLCSQVIAETTGPDDGTCTPFSSNVVGYRSFRVTSLDQTCAVTIYGSDLSFCSSTTLSLAPFSDCMTNLTVNQFSVDCQDYSVAISATPSVFPAGSGGDSDSNGNDDDNNSTSSAQDSSTADGGLSEAAKAGIAVGASVLGVLLLGFLVFFIILKTNRRKKRQMMQDETDNDNRYAAPPSELLSHRKMKPPAELPSHATRPVEAPGDERWPQPQELAAEDVPDADVDGSATTLKDDFQFDFGEEKREEVVKSDP